MGRVTDDPDRVRDRCRRTADLPARPGCRPGASAAPAPDQRRAVRGQPGRASSRSASTMRACRRPTSLRPSRRSLAHDPGPRLATQRRRPTATGERLHALAVAPDAGDRDQRRATSLSISSGSVEAQPIDGLGALTGAPSQVVVGTPLALGASARWRLIYDSGSSTAPVAAGVHVIPRALHALGVAAGHAAAEGDDALLAVPVAEFAAALRRSPTRAAAAMSLASFRGGVGASLSDLDDDEAAHSDAPDGDGDGRTRWPLPRPRSARSRLAPPARPSSVTAADCAASAGWPATRRAG
jgi:hypothetical protein